jgi:GT2 family glycosyltransferase
MKTRVRSAGGPNGAARAKAAPSPRLAIEIATWLSESDLLVIGRLPAAVAAAAGRGLAPGGPRFLQLPCRPGEDDAGTARVLVHWPLAGALPSSGSTPGAPSVMIAAAEVRGRTAAIQDFAREGLAWHDPQTRSEVLEFAVRAIAIHVPSRRRPSRGGALIAADREVRLSANLHALREALRERLPVSLTSDGPMGLIDSVAMVDRDAFFVRGRVRVGTSRFVRVTAVSPEGSGVDLLKSAYWYDLKAPDDAHLASAWKGFTAFFTCAPSLRPNGWLVELETSSGELLEVGAPRVTTHAADVIRTILEDLSVEALPATTLRTGQVVPAMRRLQQARLRAAELEMVEQFGTPADSPTVSVIVPLYRRIDLIEHQLTQFADDPAMQSADLIYVLDSPELKDELIAAARRLHRLYRQPFRVAVLSENVGFAGANNFGASIASGRILLLLNSDVFPEAPGWLGEMVRFYDSLPNAGAVGPKLLYEDDTLQHAGMFFERMSDSQSWNNEHYFKGMHRDLPAAATSRPVAAVTGACLMVAKDLYLTMGGLSGDYVQGDFEDSELCLRLLEAGRQNWYFAGVALYHLEASSYDPERRRLHDGFNRWLHTHLWGERLGSLAGAGGIHLAATPAAAPAQVEDEMADEVAVGAPSGR